ncbi:MAG: DUF4150 domain-containing protein [Deltaproteobacteria bacterium]|jgi:hypothetical protein|nr:DUF4150 domain-containing protein [Deltaproteobacteria bacterium]
MFALTVKGGVGTSGPPDVCKTPTPGGPVPIPYVNIFQNSNANISTVAKKVLIVGAMSLTIKSKIMLSSGDEPGTLGGVKSGTFIGPCKYQNSSGSSIVKFEGQKALPMGAMTEQNGVSNFNTIGCCPMAAQTKVTVAK